MAIGRDLQLPDGTPVNAHHRSEHNHQQRCQPQCGRQSPLRLWQAHEDCGWHQLFDGYTQINDPGFAAVSPVCAASDSACNTLRSGYSNKAIVDPNGNIILANPQPGEAGSLGYTTVRGPKAMLFDMNLVKRFQITETKQFEFRIDAVNILNHPNFAAPNVNIDNTDFGVISNLLNGANNVGGNGGMRSFVINTRINF